MSSYKFIPVHVGDEYMDILNMFETYFVLQLKYSNILISMYSSPTGIIRTHE